MNPKKPKEFQFPAVVAEFMAINAAANNDANLVKKIKFMQNQSNIYAKNRNFGRIAQIGNDCKYWTFEDIDNLILAEKNTYLEEYNENGIVNIPFKTADIPFDISCEEIPQISKPKIKIETNVIYFIKNVNPPVVYIYQHDMNKFIDLYELSGVGILNSLHYYLEYEHLNVVILLDKAFKVEGTDMWDVENVRITELKRELNKMGLKAHYVSEFDTEDMIFP